MILFCILFSLLLVSFFAIFYRFGIFFFFLFKFWFRVCLVCFYCWPLAFRTFSGLLTPLVIHLFYFHNFVFVFFCFNSLFRSLFLCLSLSNYFLVLISVLLLCSNIFNTFVVFLFSNFIFFLSNFSDSLFSFISF